MKKSFIVFISLGLALILIIGFGWYYYDKNIRYGLPINVRDVLVTDGFYFDNAKSEKTMGFWNSRGNFSVALDSFSDVETASKSFDSKKKIYLDSAPYNKEIVTEKEISGNRAFFVKFENGGYFIITQVGDKVFQATNSDRTEQDLEKFVKWFIRYNL